MSAREIYRTLHNYLAGQHIGSTRAEALMHEALKALLCKSYLQADRASSPGDIVAQYRSAWPVVRSDLVKVFDRDEKLDLSDENLREIDKILGDIDLHSPDYDPFGDLYEAFVGDSLKGQAGQFFTPQNAVQLLIDMVDPQPGERVLDPACGAGGFLSSAVRHFLAMGVDPSDAAKCVRGIDKDQYLARLTQARLALLTSAEASVYTADSLAWSGNDLPHYDAFGKVDVILANPPFGAKIVAASKEVQESFDLGYQWRNDRKTGEWTKTPKLQRSPSPQVLFMERCLDLLRPGGRMGIVVPESLISSRTHQYVVDFVRKRADILAVIGMPESLFKTSGSGGTHTKTCLIVAQKFETVSKGNQRRPATFMAEAKWCGNDSRGRRIFPDELPEIAVRWRNRYTDDQPLSDHLGYMVQADDLVEGILAPRYYNPDVQREMELLKETHDLVRIEDLVNAGVLEIRTGDEVGKPAYGTGTIPFVRTSDISNWEIKLDPKQGVSQEIYDGLANKQNVAEGDILMVRDGTYLIGTCAYVTKYDTKIIYQSHILKIRVRDKNVISPYLLLAALSSAPVKRQIFAKRFTQDIIDTLGNRLREVVLPIPKDPAVRERVTQTVERVIRDRTEARELARLACLDIIGQGNAETLEEELEISP
ncbi:N-6 DNA methylase [Streptosporangium sandarakinum]|uniref:N-6 DNA methylase n=1 Tax=Streptosporangium sandarakinum TaxID=1260955 RepID=UPI00379B7DFF